MNALRAAARQPARALRQQRPASTISVVSHTSSASSLPLSNVEAQWEKLPKDEQVAIYRQLETLQKKDWRTMTIDEKKAGACMNGFRRDQRVISVLSRTPYAASSDKSPCFSLIAILVRINLT